MDLQAARYRPVGRCVEAAAGRFRSAALFESSFGCLLEVCRRCGRFRRLVVGFGRERPSGMAEARAMDGGCIPQGPIASRTYCGRNEAGKRHLEDRESIEVRVVE